MKKIISVYRDSEYCASIKQTSIKRQWMEDTPGKHAYQCMPVSLANTIGWQISFPEDIIFRWDGISDSSDSHVKIIKGHRYCSTARGNATISFNTYLNIKTDEDVTTLIIPVPNNFNSDAQCFTALISTSFYKPMLPIAWKIITPNKDVVIPAGEPVATIIPISLGSLQDFEVKIKNKEKSNDENIEINKNLEYTRKKIKAGKFSHLYRRAENYIGESIGKHECQTLRLETTEE